MGNAAPRRRGMRGYTLIELLVVLAALGLLLAISAPRYTRHVDQAREITLRHNLRGMREAIDKFYVDRSRYPKDLQELAKERYLREVPYDPVTDRSDTWISLPPPGQQEGAVQDVRSGAIGRAQDGSAYAEW